MISAKNLIQLSVLLLLSAPLFAVPTHAQTIGPSVAVPPCGNIGDECPLSIQPSIVQGSTVTVNVVLNDTIGLINWDINVHYDPTVLKPIRVDALDSSNTWTSSIPGSGPPALPTPPPWTSGSCSTGNSYNSTGNGLLASSTATPCIPITTNDANGTGSAIDPGCTVHFDTGCVAEGQAILGAMTNITSTTGATLFSIEFSIKAAGMTTIGIASYPQRVHGLFVNTQRYNLGLDPGQGRLLFLSPKDGKANGIPIGSAAFIKSKVDSAIHHLKLSSGNVQTLSGLVSNTGTIPVNARINFVIISEAGDVSFVSTGTLLMPVGANGILSVSYTVPSLPLRYHVTGILTIGDPNGIFFENSGDTATTAYSVVL
jgi:hypothetical protein